MDKLFSLVVWMGGLCCLSGSVLALEAVVQSGVGAGSAVAGSIGAVNARADALQGNVAAVNLIVQQQAEQIKNLQTQVSQTLDLVREITGGTVTRETRNTEVVERIISCNAQGMLWDGTRCAEISSTVPKGTLCGMRSAFCEGDGRIYYDGYSGSGPLESRDAMGRRYPFTEDFVKNTPCNKKEITASCNLYGIDPTTVKCPEGFKSNLMRTLTTVMTNPDWGNIYHMTCTRE